MRSRERSNFLALRGVRRGCVELGAALPGHPAPGAFGSLTIKPSCSHPLLTHMYIHICNRDHTYKTISVSSWNGFIWSGFIACIFPMKHPPFHYPVDAYHILAQPEIWGFFPSQRINIKKWSIFFQMLIFFLFLIIVFKFTEAVNKYQGDRTTSVAL